MPATYSPQQLGIKAPAGGFQQGGWYEGRQYWGGQLGDPGVVINPEQAAGYGQMVSQEVMRAGSVAAGLEPTAYETFIAGQYGKKGQAQPTSQEQVTPYLNNFQQQQFQASTAPEVRIHTPEELRAELLPEGGYPAPLDRTKLFEELRTEQGVSALEQQLTDLKAQEDELYAGFREQKFTEEGKPVPMGVIQGRIGEEERTYRERVDYVGRQVARVTDQLNTKYNLISTIINLEGLDYGDAVKEYETKFETNLKIFDLIAGERKEARSIFESDRDAARANLQIYMNALTKGNLDYGSLSADQKLMVNKLEVQSGLPIGFMGSIRKDPDADIVFTTSNEGITQVGIRNADGTISVQSYGTRISGGGKQTESELERDALSEMSTWLGEKGGEDNFVSPDEWNYAKQLWVQGGYPAASFDKTFKYKFVGVPEDRGFDSTQFNLEQ